MEPDADERRYGFAWTRRSRHIVKAHGHVVLLEQSQYVIVVPTGMPEFERVLHRGIARESVRNGLSLSTFLCSCGGN